MALYQRWRLVHGLKMTQVVLENEVALDKLEECPTLDQVLAQPIDLTVSKEVGGNAKPEVPAIPSK